MNEALAYVLIILAVLSVLGDAAGLWDHLDIGE